MGIVLVSLIATFLYEVPENSRLHPPLCEGNVCKNKINSALVAIIA